MIDQEPTRFLSKIEGGMSIGLKAGTGISENSRYGVGSGSKEGTADETELRVFWGPRGTSGLLGAVFRGSKNFLDGCRCMFLLDGRGEELVSSRG